MNKHTLLPWSLASKIEDDEYSLNIVPANGINYNAALIAQSCHNVYFYGDEARANAEFIVTACNNHYQLLAALEKCREWFDKHGADYEIGSPYCFIKALSVINNIKTNQ